MIENKFTHTHRIPHVKRVECFFILLKKSIVKSLLCLLAKWAKSCPFFTLFLYLFGRGFVLGQFAERASYS